MNAVLTPLEPGVLLLESDRPAVPDLELVWFGLVGFSFNASLGLVWFGGLFF